MPPPPDVRRAYRVSSQASAKAWVFFAGGIGLLVVALGGFLLALRARTMTQLNLHLTTTVPCILAVGLFAAGYRLARSPREVAIDDRGVEVWFGQRQRQWSWDEIAWAEVKTQATT